MDYAQCYSLLLRSQLSSVANQRWVLFSETDRERMSRMAAAAAWGLGQWDAMERYVGYIPRDTTDGAFYRAVLAVHRDQFMTASEVSYRLQLLMEKKKKYFYVVRFIFHLFWFENSYFWFVNLGILIFDKLIVIGNSILTN